LAESGPLSARMGWKESFFEKRFACTGKEKGQSTILLYNNTTCLLNLFITLEKKNLWVPYHQFSILQKNATLP